jgi:ATP phosphoribosyltransferase
MEKNNGKQREIRISLLSKGHLAEVALSLMKDAGLQVMKSIPRQYEAKIPALPGVNALCQRPGDKP